MKSGLFFVDEDYLFEDKTSIDGNQLLHTYCKEILPYIVKGSAQCFCCDWIDNIINLMPYGRFSLLKGILFTQLLFFFYIKKRKFSPKRYIKF